MANGDTFIIGVPQKNVATSATMLVHNGSAFGTQHTAFWVQRFGLPACSAVIRGDNFSNSSPGVMPVGILGVISTASAGAGMAGAGVLGTVIGKPGLWDGQIGVMGIANSIGVIGKALVGRAAEDISIFGTGVIGQCDDGIGVHGSATTGFGIIGESVDKAGVTGTSVNGLGIEARSNKSHGLQATSQSGDGVFGNSTNAFGVEGITQQGPAGVRGQSNRSVGVLGASDESAGVHGQSNGSDGVFGESALAIGVHGRSKARAGVVGESVQGDGVMGFSPRTAVLGWSTGTTSASVGVVGWSSAGEGVHGESDTGTGIFGRSSSGMAAHFIGNVVVEGSFSVVGGSKSAAVRHPDGTHRLLFALESPESYFEDFGEVTLTGSSVVVKLDKDFAALVKRNKYQVFLTSYGPESLYVRKRGSESFEIARVNDGKVSKLRKVRVGYRIVARRADLKPARLPKTEISKSVAEVTKPAIVGSKAELRPTKARKVSAVITTPSVMLTPLPSVPKIPTPDLKALAEAKPGEEEA